MSVAFVKEFTDAAAASISTGTNVTIGNFLVVCFDWDSTSGQTVTSVDDNAGGGSNTWAQIGTTQTGNIAGVPSSSAMFWAKAKATETLSITPHFSAAASPEIYGQEWSGQDTTSSVDSSQKGAGTNSAPTVTFTTIADNCGIAAFCTPTSSAPGAVTGYTNRSSFNGNSAESRTANKTPAGSETITYANGSIDWHLHAVAIAPPSSGDILMAQAHV
jgi:hypothetical protein